MADRLADKLTQKSGSEMLMFAGDKSSAG